VAISRIRSTPAVVNLPAEIDTATVDSPGPGDDHALRGGERVAGTAVGQTDGVRLR
jgi:hypothetical protein